jgi:hypothetical protein
MSQLIAAAGKVDLLRAPALRMAEGARDFRDTVHANAEVRERLRPGREDAELLLVLVRLIYRDLSK